jgi:hypothetical protein
VKLAATATLLAAFLLTPSIASAAPGFSNADCANPAFRAYMQARIGHGKMAVTNKLNTNRFNYGPISEATTVARTGNSITCEVVLDLSGTRGTHQLHGRFTAMQSPKGGASWKWQPAY